MVKRLSGLQKDVLCLYRAILREAVKKDRSEVAASAVPVSNLLSVPNSSTSYASSEFRKQSESVSRNDFRTIEHMIRAGKKHIKLLKMPGVRVVGGAS
mmetsp:Transcript_14956/g.43556  ORF Transcript_14956/g.43556 Transcript_14956/m.43556 type:complete len:98 (-) Transcript_14956:503-796(-)